MKQRLSGVRLQLVLAAALAALLVVLATLQYKWIGEVRDADRERMRASARRAAEGVAGDFGREISRAIELFGLPPGSRDGAEPLGSHVAAAARRWGSESKFPTLLAEAFVADESSGALRLDRLDLSSGAVEPADWTAALEPLRDAMSGGDPGGTRPSRRPFGPQVFADVPAILIPDMRRPESPGEPRGGAPRWLILRLDERALRSEFLPELVQRHFGSAADYDVAVLRRGEPNDLLYTTRPGFPPRGLARPDAEVFFFGGRQSPGGPEGPGGPPPGMGRRAEPDRRGDLRPPPGARGDWRLVALHRSGSLESAVEKTRLRNLAVSVAILLLLAAVAATLLVSANRTRSLARQQLEFVAGVTHELRTPLAAIRTAGQNLADGVVGDEERVRQYGELVVREGRRLSELIEQALATAGIEARRGGLQGPPVSIAPVLGESVAVCRALADQKGTAIDLVIGRALPPVAADRSTLRTMFENLIANAVKYGGDAGRVAVHARAGEGGVEVSVSDLGPGIAERDLPHIFEPFYRGEHNDGGRIAGSGLGLSLVKRIADALGGSVAVASSAEEGTTFTITLPAAEGGKSPAGAPLEAET